MTRNRMQKMGIATALLATCAVPMLSASSKPMSKMGGLSAMDKNFLKAVNGANLAEMAYAPVVMKQGKSESAKDFARLMVQDHSKANREVVALAKSKGVKLPHAIPDEEQAVIDRLAMESGMKFDMAYKHEMIRDHATDVGEMEREISLGSDASVRALAAKLLPVLKTHLQKAQSMDVGAMNDGS